MRGRALKKIAMLSLLLAIGGGAITLPTQGMAQTFTTPVELVSVDDATEIESLFDLQADGWLGSDVAHSIPINDDRVIWLFADTFIGQSDGISRLPGWNFINSSIGLQDLSGGFPGTVEFYWGPGPSSIFPTVGGLPGNLYWPTMGFYLDGDLFVFCYAIESGLNVVGTILIRVGNPEAPPTQWQTATSDFGIGNANFGVHSGVYLDDTHVYMLGYKDDNGRQAILARALQEDFLNGGASEILEFWSNGVNGPEWTSTSDDLVYLFTPGNTETHIQYDQAWDLYYVTTYGAFDDTIYLTVAEELTGPWSDPFPIYDIPEHAVSFPIISYAVRPHPGFSTQPGEVFISYATNAWGTVDPLFTAEGFGIYRPHMIRLQLQLKENFGNSWSIYGEEPDGR